MLFTIIVFNPSHIVTRPIMVIVTLHVHITLGNTDSQQICFDACQGFAVEVFKSVVDDGSDVGLVG